MVDASHSSKNLTTYEKNSGAERPTWGSSYVLWQRANNESARQRVLGSAQSVITTLAGR